MYGSHHHTINTVHEHVRLPLGAYTTSNNTLRIRGSGHVTLVVLPPQEWLNVTGFEKSRLPHTIITNI